MDLDGLTILASAGLAVLTGLRQDAGRQGVRLHPIGRGNRAVCRPLQVLVLEAALDLQPDARAAVAEPVPARQVLSGTSQRHRPH